MAKPKYRFNPDTLTYDKLNVTFKQKLFNLFPHFGASILLAIFIVFIFYNFVDSPKVKHLKREINQYKVEYNLLNKQLSQVENVLADIQYRDNNIYRTVFEADPIPESVRKAGFGGVNKYKDLEGYDNSNIVISTKKRLDIILKELYVQSKSYDEVAKMANDKEKMLAHIPAIIPIANKDLHRIASFFGYRMHPILKIMRLHEGMDFSAKRGTPIHATGDAVVFKIKKSNRGYGNVVILNHGYGYKTVYAHMSKILVNEGEKVKRGQVIGLVGSTGLSVAPHVHYEVRKNDKPINPINFYSDDITPTEYNEIINMSKEQGGQSLD